VLQLIVIARQQQLISEAFCYSGFSRVAWERSVRHDRLWFRLLTRVELFTAPWMAEQKENSSGILDKIQIAPLSQGSHHSGTLSLPYNKKLWDAEGPRDAPEMRNITLENACNRNDLQGHSRSLQLLLL